MNSNAIPGEAEQLRRLKNMKRLPLLLLALMALLFVLTLRIEAPWAGWVHAFAEAGMVGALADWFAVVALFRHPLGLPIPHTAIIPRRKDELGDALARFVADHFLHPDVVRLKLESVNLAKNAANWLKSPGGRERVVELAVRGLRWTLASLHEQRVKDFIRRLSGRRLAGVNPAPLLGRGLEWLVQDGRHQQVLTQALRFSIVLLHDNRDTIRGRVQQESPWWLPGFVDDRIVVQMLDRIETLLLQMALDPDHPMRSEFNDWAVNWARELQTSPEYRRWGEQVMADLLNNEELLEYFYRLWADVAGSIEEDLDDPDSRIRLRLSGWLENLAEELDSDAAIQAWVNGWLVNATVSMVDENRHAIASLISDTVHRWDAHDTAYRVELAIGRDLQFIRINGTLVGGLVGLVIHALTMWL